LILLQCPFVGTSSTGASGFMSFTIVSFSSLTSTAAAVVCSGGIPPPILL